MGSELNLPPELTLVRSEEEGVRVVALSGDLDLRSIGEVDAALAGHGEGARVCLDVTQLLFIDSTGLASVVRAHQALTGAGASFAVACSPTGSVRRTLETTGLTALLTIVESRAAALQSLG